MKKEKIYVIYDYFYKTEDTAIDSLAFKDKEKAIEARKEAELLYYKEFRNKLS